MNWIKLETESQIEQLKSDSYTQGVVIFKHSTRCGISSMVLKQFQKEKPESSKLSYYLLDLIAFRSISNLVSKTFDLHHESPQLLVIRNGHLIHHASHSNISHDRINTMQSL